MIMIAKFSQAFNDQEAQPKYKLLEVQVIEKQNNWDLNTNYWENKEKKRYGNIEYPNRIQVEIIANWMSVQ